ncbi:hypothetical protein ACFFWE_19355 [Sphaerisporangium melleum]|uniref:Uncharacterized protein n=1 Tax=Sphaerisporangium melleum TaxID=321316 RepID=A0A917RA37_9ACTN|nr:hypothetical protein [Sphaerisporangium melleum]GGK96877.1 hypothetical protein GCM10007964_43860 [Sphaerisporangium melleum]
MNASPRVLGLAAVATALLVSGCGGGSATTAGAQPSPGGAGGGGAAFAECMRKNGVDVPMRRPGGGAPTARPSGSPFARPSGGPGGFGTMSPEMRKAFEACRSLMPQGRRGPGGQGQGFDPSAMQAFRSCMKDNGAELPEKGGMRQLKTEDPAVAKALDKCRPLLPTTPPTPQPTT